VEIIDKIIGYLRADDDLPALASAAQVNQCMYDLAIPRLYETVTINQRNWRKVGYGHTAQRDHMSHPGTLDIL
jgi:hypothetical protein